MGQYKTFADMSVANRFVTLNEQWNQIKQNQPYGLKQLNLWRYTSPIYKSVAQSYGNPAVIFSGEVYFESHPTFLLSYIETFNPDGIPMDRSNGYNIYDNENMDWQTDVVRVSNNSSGEISYKLKSRFTTATSPAPPTPHFQLRFIILASSIGVVRMD